MHADGNHAGRRFLPQGTAPGTSTGAQVNPGGLAPAERRPINPIRACSRAYRISNGRHSYKGDVRGTSGPGAQEWGPPPTNERIGVRWYCVRVAE